jgi:glycosyltransferase involved in cell wall biosynthesis
MMISLGKTIEDQKNLIELCKDRQLITNEIFRPNAYYGINHVLKQYSKIPENTPIRTIIPHGIVLDENHIWMAEKTSLLDTVMVYPPYRKKVYQTKMGKNIQLSASPFCYVKKLLQHLPSPQRSGTLFFPSHSTHHVSVEMDFESLADNLVELSERFQPIKVCIYWRDFNLGHHKPFQERGLPVVSAGHIYDKNFLIRLYHLMSQHKYAAGNSLGSHIFYSTYAGCSYFHLENFPVNRLGDENVLRRDVAEASLTRKKQLKRIFAIENLNKNHVKNTLSNKYLGSKYLKDPSKLHDQLLQKRREKKQFAVEENENPNDSIITHVIQQLTLGGASRTMISTAKNSSKLDNFSHQIISLIPADPKAEKKALQVGIRVINPSNLKEIHRLIEDSHIVQVHWWNNPEIQVFLRTRMPASRLLTWFHVAGDSPPQVITEELIKFSDYAVACSPYTYQRSVFQELPPEIKLQKTAMVYGAADFDRLANIKPQDHEDFNVGYIGTVDFIKMHPNYITMNAAVEIPDVKFLICGGGQEQILRKQAKNLGAEDRFQFLGYVDDIKSVIEILDVFGYPLCVDTYAAAELTLQEVMYAGIPPVVFPHGGIKNLVINDFTGIVVHSELEYKQAIEHLYHHPDERRRLGENAKAYAEQIFGAKNAASKINTIYEKMLEKPKVDRVWGKIAGERILDQPITIDDLTHRGEKKAGSDIFIESLGNLGHHFAASKYSEDKYSFLEADKIIADSSILLRSSGSGGILHYRNYFANDPYLFLWSGLVLHKNGNHLEAIQNYSKALKFGLEHWRVFWYLAKSAEIINNEQLIRQSLEVVLNQQPDFSPAKALLTKITGQQTKQCLHNNQNRSDGKQTYELSAREVFQKILNSPDIIRSLQKHESYLDQELLDLVNENKTGAMEKGDHTLANGLENLADYIEEVLKTSV